MPPARARRGRRDGSGWRFRLPPGTSQGPAGPFATVRRSRAMPSSSKILEQGNTFLRRNRELCVRALQGLAEIPVRNMVSYFREDRCTYSDDGDMRRVVDQ